MTILRLLKKLMRNAAYQFNQSWNGRCKHTYVGLYREERLHGQLSFQRFKKTHHTRHNNTSSKKSAKIFAVWVVSTDRICEHSDNEDEIIASRLRMSALSPKTVSKTWWVMDNLMISHLRGVPIAHLISLATCVGLWFDLWKTQRAVRKIVKKLARKKNAWLVVQGLMQTNASASRLDESTVQTNASVCITPCTTSHAFLFFANFFTFFTSVRWVFQRSTHSPTHVAKDIRWAIGTPLRCEIIRLPIAHRVLLGYLDSELTYSTLRLREAIFSVSEELSESPAVQAAADPERVSPSLSLCSLLSIDNTLTTDAWHFACYYFLRTTILIYHLTAWLHLCLLMPCPTQLILHLWKWLVAVL
jgi:hypothetical protein